MKSSKFAKEEEEEEENKQTKRNKTFMTPSDPHLEIIFGLALPHFSIDFIKKGVRLFRSIILHQIQGSPEEFETSPIYSPPLFTVKIKVNLKR